MRWIIALMFVLATALGPPAIAAAEGFGTVEGRVEYAVTGRPITGATAILMRDQSSERAQTQTSADGHFVFSAVREGLYSIEVDATEHVGAIEPGVRILENKAARRGARFLVVFPAAAAPTHPVSSDLAADGTLRG